MCTPWRGVYSQRMQNRWFTYAMSALEGPAAV